jgi:hypothetical protein
MQFAPGASFSWLPVLVNALECVHFGIVQFILIIYYT